MSKRANLYLEFRQSFYWAQELITSIVKQDLTSVRLCLEHAADPNNGLHIACQYYLNKNDPISHKIVLELVKHPNINKRSLLTEITNLDAQSTTLNQERSQILRQILQEKEQLPWVKKISNNRALTISI